MPDPSDTGLALDSAIAANRIATPARDTTQRIVPRSSIAELNSMDLEDIKDRLNKMPVDERSSFGKFMDLLDAPRNLIDSTVARVALPGLYKRKLDDGDIGTGGVPNIHGSDVLQELGVSNHIARAVGGFALDLATDPLTFIGPGAAGAVERLAKGGVVQITKPGAKIIRNAAKELVETGSVVHPDGRAFLEGLGWDQNRVKSLRDEVASGKATAKDAIATVMDDVHGPVTTGAVGRAFSRVGLWDKEYEGGAIGKYLYATDKELPDEAARGAAKSVRDFVGKYGKGTEPGLAFGDNATSQVAHIPGTNIGIRVPAFTSGALVASRNLRMARDADMGLRGVDAVLNAAKAAGEAAGPSLGLEGHLNGIRDAKDRITELGDESARIRTSGEAEPISTQMALEANTAQIRDARKAVAGHMQEINRITREVTDNPTVLGDGEKNARSLIALGYAKDAATAEAHQAQAQADSMEFGVNHYIGWRKSDNPDHYLAGLTPETRAKVQRIIEDPVASKAMLDTLTYQSHAAQRLSTVYHAPLADVAGSRDWAAADMAKYALGTSDDVQGISALGSMAESMRRSGLKDDNSMVQSLESADRFLRGKFNLRSGTAHETAYAVKQGLKGSPVLKHAIAMNIMEDTTKALRDAGVPLTAENHKTASVLMTHMMQKLVDPESAFVFWNRPEFPEMTYEQVKAAHDGGLDVGSELFKTLYQAGKDGFLSQRHPGLGDSLEAIARQGVKDIQSVGDAEVRDGILNELKGGYVPRSKTGEAAAKVGRVGEAFGGVGKGGKEPFRQHRTFGQYRFVDPETGERKVFYEADRGLNPVAVSAMTNIDEPARNSLLTGAANATRYDELVKAGHQLPGPRQTDVLEMNQLARSGRFAPMLGGPVGDMFNESLPVVMMNRTAAHEHAAAQRTLGLIVDKVALNAQESELRKVMNSPGAKVAIKGGAEALSSPTRSTLGGAVAGVRMGGTLYRQIDGGLRARGTIENLLGTAMNGKLLPDVWASRIEDIAGGYEKKRDQIAEVADAFTGLWRTQVLTHPSWMVNDLIGNLSLMAGGDGQGAALDWLKLPRHMADALTIALHKYHPDRLKNVMVDLRGRSVPGAELAADAAKVHAFDNNIIRGEEMMAVHSGAVALPNANVPGKFTGPGRAALDAIDPRRIGRELAGMGKMGEYVKASTEASGRTTPGIGNYAAGAFNSGDRAIRGVVAPWFRLNGLLNDTMRLATYMNLVDQGYAPAEAGRAMLRMLYNYHDLSRVDEKMRRLVPFWSWVRNNTPHQFKLLATNPKFAAAFPKLKEAIETAASGDTRVPERMRPQWIRDQMAVQFSSDPQTRQAFLMMSSLPPKEMLNYGAALFGWGGVQDLMHYFSGNLNPAFGTFVGLATGREPFSGRTVSSGGDISPGRFVGNQLFRPLSEIGTGGADKGPLARSFGQGIGAGVTRAILGGKVQDISDERLHRQLLNQSKDEENQLRRRIAKSEAYQDAGSSFEARIQLMALYRRMTAQGLADEVPRWAREQLATPAEPSAIPG